MKRNLQILLSLGIVLMLVPLASATTFYSSGYTGMAAERASWLGDLGISTPDTTVNFESGFLQDEDILNDTLAGGLTISSPNGYGYVTNDPSDLGSSSPLDTYALAVDERDVYTFNFNTPISYFAFYMLDHGATTLTINFASGDTEDAIITAGGATGFDGIFFAFSADQDISSLYIPITGGDGEVGIDNIEFGAPVPEPATIFLFGTGLVGLIGSRFRKKR